MKTSKSLREQAADRLVEAELMQELSPWLANKLRAESKKLLRAAQRAQLCEQAQGKKMEVKV